MKKMLHELKELGHLRVLSLYTQLIPNSASWLPHSFTPTEQERYCFASQVWVSVVSPTCWYTLTYRHNVSLDF